MTVTETTEAPARRAKRVCERCFQFDDHPKIVLAVTADGPLGLHPPARIVEVTQLLRGDLPSNVTEIAAMGADQGERAVGALPPAQQDAMLSLAFLMDPTTCILHMDCYESLGEELKPQRSVYAEDEDGNVLSEEDTTKITPGDHALVGVRKGLKGKELARHLTSQAKPEEH